MNMVKAANDLSPIAIIGLRREFPNKMRNKTNVRTIE
jgi:hypothetical protein